MTRIISKAVALASRTLTMFDVRWWPKFYTTILLVRVVLLVHQCFWIDSVMCQDSSDNWTSSQQQPPNHHESMMVVVDPPSFVQRSHRSFDPWSSPKNMDPTSLRRTTTKTTTMQQQPQHLNDENIGSLMNQWPNTMKNITVTLGRNATFECVFPKLKDFQLVWFHQDKKNHHHTLLAMHDTIISKNGRISVRSHANTTFYLTIHDAQENDRGIYKCQVNTKPMRTQSAHLEVNVPPSFIEAKTSSDVDIAENSSVRLQCQAEGRPSPEITWRREDGQPIVIDAGMYDDNNNNSFALIKGHDLNLNNITRHQMGAYLCIASNGIPPTISKRIFLGVGFAPVIWTNKKMVDGSIQSRVTLECFVESYPRASVYWQKNDEFPPIIYSDRKYSIFINDSDVPYRFVARLRINDLQKNDFTKYTCVATNKIGTSKATVQLREVEKKFHHHPKHRNHLGQKAPNYYELNSNSNRNSNNNNYNNNNNNNNNNSGRKKLYQNIMTTRIPDMNIRRTGNQASAGNINDNSNNNNNNKGSRKKININYDDDDDDGVDDDDATEQDMWQYETNYLSPGLSPDRNNANNNNGARSFHHPWQYHHYYYSTISSTLQQPWCGLILIIINVHVVAVWILDQR